MQETPRSNRLHIALIGCRNAGKSSLLNALTGQEAALVSAVPGTTTDPVHKAAELPTLGPVEWVDTAGLDDEGDLGRQRVERTWKALDRADMAILVVDSTDHSAATLRQIEGALAVVRQKQIPCVMAQTKADLPAGGQENDGWWPSPDGIAQVRVSARTGAGLVELVDAIISAKPHDLHPDTIVGDLIQPGDTVLMVTPIDQETPKGRLILPQVQTLRDLLDHGAQTMVVRETELAGALAALSKPPRLVITDSQVFHKVAQVVPPDVPLTSFSILFARYKGDLEMLAAGVAGVPELRPGDPVLIAEACTHQPVGEDIGRVKIPQLLTRKLGGSPRFTWCNGNDFPDDLSAFKLVIHCGGCMIQAREMRRRLKRLEAGGVPVVNYGVLLAYLHGVLPRAVAPLRISSIPKVLPHI